MAWKGFLFAPKLAGAVALPITAHGPHVWVLFYGLLTRVLSEHYTGTPWLPDSAGSSALDPCFAISCAEGCGQGATVLLDFISPQLSVLTVPVSVSGVWLALDPRIWCCVRHRISLGFPSFLCTNNTDSG